MIRRGGASAVRLAVLGVGDWTRRFHLPVLHALRQEGRVEIAGLWNRTREVAEAAAREFAVPRVYPSLDAVQDDDAVDGYVVLVHSSVSADIVLRLAARGRPILVEKPPGASYAQSLALAAQVRVPNVVGFNRRYMPLNRTFASLVGTLARPYYAECQFHRHERRIPRFVLETGIHGINFIEYLCGAIVSVVTERKVLDAAGAEAFVCRVVFASGMTGVLKFFPCSGASVERYEVHGIDRSVYLHCPASFTSDHPGRIAVHESGEVAAEIVGEQGPGTELATSGILNEYREFLEVIADPLHPTCSNFGNACNTMRIAEAIDATPASGEHQ